MLVVELATLVLTVAWFETIVVVAEATLEKLVAVVPWNVVSVEAVLLNAE
jgi:hypothetical protein